MEHFLFYVLAAGLGVVLVILAFWYLVWIEIKICHMKRRLLHHLVDI